MTDGAAMLSGTRRRLRGVRRRMVAARLASAAAPLAGLIVIASAVAHAANPLERTLALAAALGTFLATVAHAIVRRIETRAIASSVPAHLAAARRRHRDERYLALFIIATLSFDLAFLIPWWVGGIGPHAGQLASPIVIWMLWVPLAVIAALGGWAIHLYRRAGRDMTAIEAMIREFDEP